MKKKFVGWPILFLTFLVTACAPAKRGEESSVTTTYSPPTPTVSKEGTHDVVHGATQVESMTTQYDPSQNGLILKGKVKVQPVDGANPFEVELDVLGKADSNGFVIMKAAKDAPSLPPEVKVGVKATCLGEKFTCGSSFTDIYIQYRGKIYHHQVESHEDAKAKESAKGPKGHPSTSPVTTTGPAQPPTKEEKKDEPAPKPKQKQEAKPQPATPAPKASAEDQDSEDEEDEGHDDSEAHGRYVGDIQGDIKQVLNDGQSEATPKDSNPSELDQVIGAPANGRLERASSLLAYEKTHNPAGFHVVNPGRERYYGSAELIYLITHMGQYTQMLIPHYTLPIGDLSRKVGGKIGRHASHQNGLDVDVAFYFKDRSIQGNLFSALNAGRSGGPVSSWMLEEQWKLFKYAVGLKYVDRIFIHQNLKKSLCQYAIKKGELSPDTSEGLAYETLRRLRPEKNHYNHFHLRVKCSKAQVRCRQMAEPPSGSGCF